MIAFGDNCLSIKSENINDKQGGCAQAAGEGPKDKIGMALGDIFAVPRTVNGVSLLTGERGENFTVQEIEVY